jgi:hypothetical protein
MAAILPITLAVADATSIAVSVDTQGAPPLSGFVDGFTFTVDGAALSYLRSAFTASSEITFFLAQPLFAGQQVLVSTSGSTTQNAAGNTIADTADFAAINNSTVQGVLGGSATGYYLTQADIERLLGSLNLVSESDLADTDTLDAATVQADIDAADAYVNLALGSAGLTLTTDGLDVTGKPAWVQENLRMAAAYYAAYLLGVHRGLFDRTQSRNAQQVAEQTMGFKNLADELLGKVTAYLVGTDTDETTGSAGAFQFIPRVRPCSTVADENTRPLGF